jgi:CysZ protein
MDLLRGAIYLIRAMGMLYQPGLRRFIFVPFLINAMLFATAISLLWFWFSSWVEYLLH